MRLVKVLFFSALLSGNAVSEDIFSWLRDETRSEARVLDYLKKENKLTQQYKGNIQSYSDELLSEWHRNRPERSDKPWKESNGFEYSVQNRILYTRQAGTQDQIELFDIGQRASGFEYHQLGAWALNPSRTQLAIAEDLKGSEQYQISIVDLTSGSITKLVDRVEASVTWSLDGKSLYFIKQESQTSRPYLLSQYVLGTGRERVIYQEGDSAWLVSTYLSSDKQFAFIQSNSDNSSEQRLLDLDSGLLSKPLQARRVGVEYYADKVGDQFYINSNHVREGFEIYSVTQDTLLVTALWKPVLNTPNETYVENFYWFSSGLVVLTHSGSTQQLTFINNAELLLETQNIAQPGQVAWVSQVGDFESNQLYIRSMSMTQPAKWQRLDTKLLTRKLYSQDQYPNYQADLYHTEQILVKSDDQFVPVTLAYRKDKVTKTSPVLLYGYGAYGVSMKPYFMPQIVSLLDRGMIYAIAHVRGGGYKGDAWYQAGKGINKPNSVLDFISSAQALKHFKKGEHPIYALGASAGGTLVASAMNQDPGAFDAAILKVPFVDVLNSMSDEKLPLTAQQYGEWGNPNIPSERTVMQSYDPYFNLQRKAYPPTLIQIGLHDRRVPYWEGAKYFEKLRTLSTGKGPYLLSTHFDQGHSTDRRRSLSQQAFEYAFFLSITQK